MASQEDKVGSLPKFGEWDVNNPATAEGFTVIFSKARDEKRTGSSGNVAPARRNDAYNQKKSFERPTKKKWLCLG